MTLAEVEATLPNGFHDAEIMELTWNYQINSASFIMQLWVAEKTDLSLEVYRAARLDVKDIVFIAMDPPCPEEFGSQTLQVHS
jgi:hypothetical protein